MIAALTIATGIWRATLALPDGQLPFNFKLNSEKEKVTIEIYNATEKILVDEVAVTNDSIFIKLPVYDSEIRAAVNGNKMTGNWFNYSRKTNQSIPFLAQAGEVKRFLETIEKTNVKLEKKYEVWFSPSSNDSSLAVGLFEQKETKVYATFLTTTGDYRFLEGVVAGDSLFLSCFDGAFAYLFKAKIEGEKIKGMYYSGNHWKQEWVAAHNDKIELPDASTLTKLKEGQNEISFRFKNLDGSDFEFPNEKYKGKVTVIQILGTWCPNCLDETAFLSPFYDRYQPKGFEVIGLSFEKTDDFNKAVSLINRIKNRFNVNYRLLSAGNRTNIAENLNMIEKIKGYPTTIFIDKKGKVRKIHTGFAGPATGVYYEKLKDDFTVFIEKLLAE